MNEREFGLKIKKRREELGMSQQDLAIALCLDQGKVSLIERGARKIDSVTELPLIANALRCSLSWFYEDGEISEEPTSPLETIMNQYFPGIEFTNFEVKRMQQFLEPIIQSYAKNDAVISKKIVTKEKNNHAA